MAIRKDAKGNAGILAVNEINEFVDEFMAPAFDGFGFDDSFREAVEKNRDESENQPAKPGSMNHEA